MGANGGSGALTRAVIGAAIEVHRHLGPGYVESVYEEALAVELRLRDIPFVRQPTVEVAYKGNLVGEARLDVLVNRHLILELKSVEHLLPVHEAQVISYLRATGHPLALLINFNVPVLKQGIRRFALTHESSATSAPLRASAVRKDG